MHKNGKERSKRCEKPQNPTVPRRGSARWPAGRPALEHNVATASTTTTTQHEGNDDHEQAPPENDDVNGRRTTTARRHHSPRRRSHPRPPPGDGDGDVRIVTGRRRRSVPPPAPPGDNERLGLLANVVEGGDDYDKYDDNDDDYDYPRVTENGRKQPLHVRTPVAPARFCRRAPSAIARAPRHGGPAEIATQAAGSAPTRLPPTTQSSARPIATISHVPLRGDFVSAWAYRRAR